MSSDRLDVVVNVLWAAPGRVGGSEDYLVRQLLGLRQAGGADFEIAVAALPAFVAAHPELGAGFTMTSPRVDRDNRALRIAAEHTWLALRTRAADVVHHGGGTRPLVGKQPTVVTVHDLQYLRFPDYFGRARRHYLAAMMPRSVSGATVIVTPTEYVRTTVIDAFGVDPDRVRVVPHGIPTAAAPSDAEIESARHGVGLGRRPYVVYPAITHPHKAHRLLVEMLAVGHPDLDDLGVVLLGGEGAGETDLQRSIAASPHGDRVVRAGRVAADVRDALVAGAEALAFPSEYEGFGAPLVEAMALSTPVVASAAAGVREVVGDAGLIVEDATACGWADAISAARSRRPELIASGGRRRSQFTLEVSGAALAAAYRAAVGESAPADRSS